MKLHRAAILLALAGFLGSPDARAFEKIWHVGGGIGARSTSESRVGLGPAVNAYASYGLDDMFDVKLDFAASNHAFEVAPGTTDRRSIYTAALGISYKLDVLEWIPYFGAHLGWLYSDLPEGLDVAAAGWVVGGMLGLDYAVTPSFGLGVMNQIHLPVDGGSFVDLFLRAEYHWGP